MFILVFTYITPVYQCLPLLTRVHLCLFVIPYDYRSYIVLVYTRLIVFNLFIRVYVCLPLYTYVYSCLPVFIHVYLSWLVFTCFP